MAAAKGERPPSVDGKPRPHGGKRAGQGRWASGPIQCGICQHPDRSRIDYLIASGQSQRSVAEQFGVIQQSLSRHYHAHVSKRYKQMVGASYNESFERLLAAATEANSESVGLLNVVIRGHASMWALALEAADHTRMSMHAARVMQALELRSRITLEVAPVGGVTINNFLMRDAAELVNTLRDNKDAVAKIEDWYAWRTQGRLIEAKANVESVD